MAQATHQRQSYLENTLQPQIHDLESRLQGSMDAISNMDNHNHSRGSVSVGSLASQLTYRSRTDDAECRQMMNKMEDLGRQFRVVQQKKGLGRQAET
jgi:hypothetical protein